MRARGAAINARLERLGIATAMPRAPGHPRRGTSRAEAGSGKTSRPRSVSVALGTRTVRRNFGHALRVR